MREENKRIKNAIEKKQRERKQKPTKKQVIDNIKEMDKIAYEKNQLILKQLQKYEQKILGNAKFNEDEYKRKKGRMKMISFNYEWEKDPEQQVIDEKRLQQTYEDTRNALMIELEKIRVTKEQVLTQQSRILTKNPEFIDIKVDEKALEKQYDERLAKFKP